MPRWSKAWTNAVNEFPWSHPNLPDELSRVIRSAVRAVLPGRQQGKNLADTMQKAERAAVRALRAATKRAAAVP